MDAGVFFVVHVWRDARGFHASARDVTCEDTDEFDDPVALARFLVARACPPRAHGSQDPGAVPGPDA
ncbi:MAG: hypothetical protein BroJett031_22120 [Betaproteobacteria bacterium]|nr:MAG: hypothetical protein BroJett031_22120 [Betaproteobacteria bacterium]